MVATLRDYLTCEYKVKVPESTAHTFTKDTIPGHSIKVPQQNNFTDCGLYLLQYVEQFYRVSVNLKKMYCSLYNIVAISTLL